MNFETQGEKESDFFDIGRQLSVAFLGGAHNSAVGQVHRIAIEMDGRFKLVAGCFSRDSEVNQQTAEKYRVDAGRAYISLDELIQHESDRIDAVIILTPTDQHKKQVIKCMGAGIPVICEKALVFSHADALEIKKHMQKQSAFLAVTYNYTGYPMVRELKNLIKNNKLGKIQQIHIEMPQEGFSKLDLNGEPAVPQGWRLHDEYVPTVSLDLGVHLHLMVDFLTNEKPEKLVSMNESLGNFSQVKDNVMCMARYSNNMTCNIWYSKTALGYRNGLKVRVFGDRGACEWYQEEPELLNFSDVYGRKYVIDRANPDAEVSGLPRYTRFKAGHPSGFIEAFANYYYDVADSLGYYLNNQIFNNEYVFGVDEALQGVKMLEAISKSSECERWVEI